MPGRTYSSEEYRYGFNGMEKDDEIKGSGNSYDFGARIYDPRIGRWLSRDPLEKKFPDVSPYVFAINNPIFLIDEDGREPHRTLAGTIEQFLCFFETAGITTLEGMYDYMATANDFDPEENFVRYIYTEKEGWVDMKHFVAAAIYGEYLGGGQEVAQGAAVIIGRDAGTVYSYEDLPSNDFGDYFGDLEFDDEKGACIDGEDLVGKDLFDAMLMTFQFAGATSPEEAPNYRQIPTFAGERGFDTPRNFSDEPMNLEGFPAAPSSLETVQEQSNEHSEECTEESCNDN